MLDGHLSDHQTPVVIRLLHTTIDAWIEVRGQSVIVLKFASSSLTSRFAVMYCSFERGVLAPRSSLQLIQLVDRVPIIKIFRLRSVQTIVSHRIKLVGCLISFFPPSQPSGHPRRTGIAR